MAPANEPLRRYAATGILVGLAATVLAHLYRSLYLLAGGAPFPEIDAVSTTLAAFVPTFLAAIAYGLLARRPLAWARPAFTIGALTLSLASTVPAFLAPLHPGFAALSAPLHVIVGATIALGIPWHAARPMRTTTSRPHDSHDLS